MYFSLLDIKSSKVDRKLPPLPFKLLSRVEEFKVLHVLWTLNIPVDHRWEVIEVLFEILQSFLPASTTDFEDSDF